MDNTLLHYISHYVALTEEEADLIKEQRLFKSYKKNEILLAEGEYPKECFLVIKGSVRAYQLKNGEERNTDFYFENDTIRPIGYLSDVPSHYYLSCLEDCWLAIGSEARNKQLVEQIPKLSQLISKMNEELLIQKTTEFDDFKMRSPEERYLLLLEKRPDILNRVPLFHLASYLGITQISLSRIRSRLARNKTF